MSLISGDQQLNIRVTSRRLLNSLPVFLDSTWIQFDGLRGFVADRGSEEDGIRTNTSIVFALAVWLYFHSEEDTLKFQQRERFVQLVRYVIDGHKTGAGKCADGRSWGHGWQSAWWAAKLGLGCWLMGSLIPAELRKALSRLIVSEANRHLQRWAPTGLAGDTKAEENAWDAEILAVALLIAPEDANANVWRLKLGEFSMNVFSVPQDRYDVSEVDGVPIREAVHTCNVHGDFTLENHGSYHFCYVASPLLSKAWAYLAIRWAGNDPPQSLHHHVSDVWEVARRSFLEHRFAYVGGQDWARYTYGEYFIIPALSYMEQVINDPEIRRIQGARLDFLAAEAEGNRDGTFFGKRFTSGRLRGQFGKYESDAYACIALTLMIEELPLSIPHGVPRVSLPAVSRDHGLISPESQVCFWRTPKMFFAFTWKYLEHDVPSLLFCTPQRDDLIEWREGNGIGRVQVWGERATVGVRSMKQYQRQIQISGRTATRNRKGRTLYETHLDIDVDLDSSVVQIRLRVMAVCRLWLVRTSGLRFNIPNDMFNRFERQLFHEEGNQRVESMRVINQELSVPNRALRILRRITEKLGRAPGERQWNIPGRMVDIDGQIRIECEGASRMVLRQTPEPDSPWQSLWVDRLEAPRSCVRMTVAAGQPLLDLTTRLSAL